MAHLRIDPAQRGHEAREAGERVLCVGQRAAHSNPEKAKPKKKAQERAAAAAAAEAAAAAAAAAPSAE
jgi:hypothetical protein